MTKTFSAVGTSKATSVRHGDSITYAITQAGEDPTFDATVVLQRSNNGFMSCENVLSFTGTASGTYECDHAGRTSFSYRFACTAFGESADNFAISLTPRVIGSVADSLSVVDGRLTVSPELYAAGGVTLEPAAVFPTVSVSTNVLLAASDGSVLMCQGALIDAAGAGYATGCILINTEATDNTDTLYVNIGDTTTSNFNAMTIAADA